MARGSCIAHPVNDRFIQIRQCYMQLTDFDPIEAGLLHLFEFWTNGKLEHIPEGEEPWITGKTIEKIADAMLGAFSVRSIQPKLQSLRDRGFLLTRQPVAHRKTLDYLLDISALQEALNAIPAIKPSATTSSDSKKAKGKFASDSKKAKGKFASDSKKAKGKFASAPYIKEISKEEEEIKTKEPEPIFFEQPSSTSTALTEEIQQPETQTVEPKPLSESSANLPEKKITTARWKETGKLGKHGYPNAVNMQGQILELLPWVELNDQLRSGYGFDPEFEAFVSKHLIKQKHYSQMQQGEFVAAIKDWIGKATESDFRFNQVMTRWEMFEARIPESDKTVKELYQQHECEKRQAADAAMLQQRAQEWEQNPNPARKKLSIKDVM